MLQRDAQNQRLYLHDVVIKKEAFDSSREHLDSTGPRGESENLYTSNILDKIAEVNKKSSLCGRRCSTGSWRGVWEGHKAGNGNASAGRNQSNQAAGEGKD